MQLFIGNLPLDVSTIELARLFAGFRHSGFHIEHKRLADGREICYAVVRMASERVAQKAIRRLAGRPTPSGQTLIVREYRCRNSANDRRTPHNSHWGGPERRRYERRTTPPTPSHHGVIAIFRNGTLF